MIIRKKTARPVVKKHDIDEIRIVTHYGSQSTDFSVCLSAKSGAELVHEEDVKSIDDGIHYLANLLKQTKKDAIDADDEY